ncbi:unnamed protein product [Vicia faba]|uniref:Uncharacterized protein n=1 Tax=Vicia faba TaxID=3906 RepID=A0AAV1AFJ4_VICFA|nr:unnamed protein product [Vicia faba]
MMTKPQVHKENEDHVHEYDKVNSIIPNVVYNNYDHASKEVKTLGESVNEIYCTMIGNDNRLSSDDMSAQINERVDFIGLMNDKITSINRCLSLKTKELPCTSIMKITHEEDHVV